MSDNVTVSVPSSISFDFPVALLPQGPKGDPGSPTLRGLWKPVFRFQDTLQEVGTAYLSQLGVSRQPDGEMHLWGNTQFNGIVATTDANRNVPIILTGLPKPIAVACGVFTFGMFGFTSNRWPPDSSRPYITPAFAFRQGGGNNFLMIDSLPTDGRYNPKQLMITDLNPLTQLEFFISYPID